MEESKREAMERGHVPDNLTYEVGERAKPGTTRADREGRESEQGAVSGLDRGRGGSKLGGLAFED